MSKQFKSLPILYPHERIQLNRFLHMEDWHFEALFMGHCTEISTFFIGTDSSGQPEYAKVFGLQARYTSTGKSCIANIFIRYDYRVYRVHDICQAADLIALLKKNAEYQELRSKDLMAKLSATRTRKRQNKKRRLIGTCR